MENIIKKAIEGGYFIPGMVTYDTFVKLELIYGLKPEYCCVLDPLFWQSLGEACGWHFCRYHGSVEAGNEEGCGDETHNGWYENALKFHEINLTEGWDKAVEYLNDLIK